MAFRKVPALIIGRANANMLAQARALGRCGIPVYSLIHRGEPAFIIKACRYVTRVYVVKSGRSEDVTKQILAIHEQERIKPVLFFAGDADITLAGRIWPQIKDHVVCTTDPERAEYLNDKSVQVTILKQAGLRVPESWRVSSMEDVEKCKEQYCYPLICRPVELSRRGSMVEKYCVINDWSALRHWTNYIFSAGCHDILIQEYIAGEAENLYLSLAACDESGVVISMVCCRKLFEYPEGLMCIGETVEHPAFQDLSIHAFSKLCLGGVLGLEFKWDEQSNEFVFIEANLRPENILAIATSAGVNLMEQAYSYSLGGKTDVLQKKTEKVIWKDISLVTLARLSGGKPPKINNRNAVTVDAFWSWSDPIPALAWYVVKIWSLVRKTLYMPAR